MRATTRLRLLALLAMLALLTAACGGGTSGDTETEAEETEAAGEATEPAAEGEATEEASADATEPAAEETGTEAAAEEPAAEGGTLVYGTLNPPASIDPAKCYDSTCSNILFNTTTQLVWFPPGADTVEPQVAESFEVSDDGLTYTFTLREGQTFHDGSDLTSEDVAFSLQRSLDINHPQGAGFLINNMESVETPDDLTVVITLSEANSTFLARLNYTVASILPSDADYAVPDAPIEYDDDTVEDAQTQADELMHEDTVIGAGPYQMTDYSPGEFVQLEAFPDFAGEAPAVQSVRIQFFEDSAQLASALAAGEVDLVLNDLGPSDISSLEGTDVEITESAGGRIRYLVVNVNQPPFDDPAVRQAIAATVDRQRIVDEVFEGRGAPLYSMIPSDYEVNADYISDIEVPELEGTPIDITLNYPLNRYGDTEPDVATTIERSLEESGLFNVETVGADWASEYSANLNTGAYGIFLLGWYPDYIDPDDYIEPFYDSEDTFLGYYASPEMDELILAEQQETDPDARADIFDQIQQLAATDMPLIPLYEEGTTTYASPRVSGEENTLDAAQILRFYVMSVEG